MSFKKQQYIDWMNQAQNTLQSAIHDKDNSDYNWSCFKAQQGAEFALKSILHGLGIPAFGHSIKNLADIAVKTYPQLQFNNQCLVTLDKLYIPTRYSDAFSSGSPFAYFTDKDADESIKCAQGIIALITNFVSKSLKI